MQLKSILLSIAASAALINAVAIPVTSDGSSKINPEHDPSFPTCVVRVGNHCQGTHPTTGADKAKYDDICSKCFLAAYQACAMTAPPDHDVLIDHETGPFPDYINSCLWLNGGGPQASKPTTPVNVPIPVDEKVKRDLEGGEPHIEVPGVTEPNMTVPSGLAKPSTKRSLEGGDPHVEVPGVTEPNMTVPSGLAKSTKN